MKSIRFIAGISGLALASAVVPSASAATLLTFEGIGSGDTIANYYNGGTGGDLGISFVNGLALVDGDSGGGGNIANEPSGQTVAFFSYGPAYLINVAAGFTDEFGFYYSAYSAGSVNVYSGLNGTGDVLGTLSLTAQYNTGCSGDPSGDFCNFTLASVGFAGTARSISFMGTQNFVVFDDIMFGPLAAGAVPETASWGMMILGFGVIGGAARYRRRSAKVAFV